MMVLDTSGNLYTLSQVAQGIHTGFAEFPADGAKNSAFLTGNVVPVPCPSLD